MSKLGNTVEDTAGGAALGSVVPGVGTVAGAAGGLIYGIASNYLGGDGGVATSGGNAFGPNAGGPRANFAYGNQGALSAGANQAAGVANGMGFGYARQGQGFYNGAWSAQDRNAPQIQGSAQARQAQIAALGGVSSNAAALQAMGLAPTNTNIAAQQLQQGQDAAMQQSLALARSGRSLGSGAAALQQAQFQNAATNQATNQQAAIANLQEQQQNRQMQLSALGAAQQGYGVLGQQAAGLNAMDVGLQAQNAQLQLGQQGVNNQTTATFGGLAQGAGQLGLGEQNLGNQILTTQLGAGEQYQNQINGHDIAQQQINSQNQGTYLQGASALAGAAAASDRDVKQNIMPAGAVDQYGQTLGAGLAPTKHAQDYQSAPTQTDDGSSQAYAPQAVQTGYGLTPQQQQSQLGQMYGADASAQAHQRWLENMSAQAANQQAIASSGSGPQTPPPPQPFQGGRGSGLPWNGSQGSGSGHGASANWGWQGNGGRVSDVSHKKDIKPAGDNDSWLSRMLWHGGLGIKSGSDANDDESAAPPPAMIRNPNNPSQLISAYSSIGDASHRAGAAPIPAYNPQEIAAYQPRPTQAPAPIFVPGTAPPDTWGGTMTPVEPAFTPKAPDRDALDAAYAAQNLPPAGFQISDAHSKARIEALSAQNRSLVSALSSTPPTREMLNQAAADQDAATPGARIAYRDPGAPPTAAMLAQAAADQDAAPVPPPDRPAIDLRPAAPYSYEYKDPERHGQGRFYGPMAQDLEKTPAGASVVKQAPDGTKMVDTSRLSLVNTGAISDLQRQVAALGGRPQKYPAFMTPRGY